MLHKMNHAIDFIKGDYWEQNTLKRFILLNKNAN